MQLRAFVVAMTLVVALLWWLSAQAQTITQACELQVQDHYRELLAERVLQQDQQTLNLTWSQQLAILGSQMRIVTTQFFNEVQLRLQENGQKAQSQEQVRQLQKQNAQLKQELETLKNGGTPPPPTAN